MALADAAVDRRAQQVAAGAGVHQRGLPGFQRQLAGPQASREHGAEVFRVLLQRRRGETGNLLAQRRQVGREVVGAAGQVLVGVAVGHVGFPHQGDAGFRHADAHAGLQQDEAGLDAADHVAQRVGQQHGIGDEGAAEQHAVGAGAFQRHEVRVLLEIDAGLAAADHRHDPVVRPVRVHEHRAEQVARTEVADPGQHAGHFVAAGHAAAAQLERFDAGQRLHRVGQAGAAHGDALR